MYLCVFDVYNINCIGFLKKDEMLEVSHYYEKI